MGCSLKFNTVIIKTILSVLLVSSLGYGFFFLFLMFAVSGNPAYGPVCLKLAFLALLFAVPVLMAIWENKKRSRKRKLFCASVVLPILGYLLLFHGVIIEYFNDKIHELKVRRDFEAALKVKNQDPIPAFLYCQMAKYYENVNCKDMLSSVSDARICRDICKNRNGLKSVKKYPGCERKDFEIILSLDCAQIMVHKVDPKKPSDVCKAAGLLNYPTGVDFFQGYYYECLDSLVRVGVKDLGNSKEMEYKTLGELLQIKTRGLPKHTKNPLPE
jgi:hypothetical protein